MSDAHRWQPNFNTSIPGARDVSSVLEMDFRSAAKNGPLEEVSFDIEGIDSPAAVMTICAGMQGLNGIRDMRFVGGARITFDPLGISKEEICTALARGGYRATEIPANRRSPNSSQT